MTHRGAGRCGLPPNLTTQASASASAVHGAQVASGSAEKSALTALQNSIAQRRGIGSAQGELDRDR